MNICEYIMETKKTFKFSDQIRVEQNLIEAINNRTSLNFIEDSIIKLHPREVVLRLICLYSICNSGISNKELSNLIKLFTQSYGHPSVITFYNLKKVGILYEISNQFFATSAANPKSALFPTSPASHSDAVRKFRHNVKKFNLIPLLETESYNIRNPTDCGYVFGGAYLPLVCKLVSNYMDMKSIDQMEEYCKQTQCRTPANLVPNKVDAVRSRDLRPIDKQRLQVVLMVGGVTFAEVSAFRFLSRQKNVPILIMTSCVTNGNTFLEQISGKHF